MPDAFADAARLCDRLKTWATEAAYPLWWRVGADHATGGFFEKVDLEGVAVDGPRRGRVLPRQIYSFAIAGDLGWKGPCYLITDIHHKSFDDLMNKTPWERYGHGKDPRCQNCMVHSGYETAAAVGEEEPVGAGLALDHRRFGRADQRQVGLEPAWLDAQAPAEPPGHRRVVELGEALERGYQRRRVGDPAQGDGELRQCQAIGACGQGFAFLGLTGCRNRQGKLHRVLPIFCE